MDPNGERFYGWDPAPQDDRIAALLRELGHSAPNVTTTRANGTL